MNFIEFNTLSCLKFSNLAQLVEQPAVNGSVLGSSPRVGAIPFHLLVDVHVWNRAWKISVLFF